MPRWLSEGISVYEEMLKNPAWGQSMNPEYRRMILEQDALTPISSLSEAFLKPKTQMDLQFAYFQSSMVVRFLVEELKHWRLWEEAIVLAMRWKWFMGMFRNWSHDLKPKLLN